MRNDVYGRQILNEDDLCKVFLRDPSQIIQNAIVEKTIQFDNILDLTNVPKLIEEKELSISIDQFDNDNQSNWYMSENYKNMDIAKYVLDLCNEDYELQRVGDELLKFQERGLFPLLRYCVYLVDKMRENNIVWGVGRGSSVSSYVLFLIGIHRINSLHYDLSIDEFLK